MVVRRNGEERVSCCGGGGRGGVRIERRGEPGGWWRVDQRSRKCRGRVGRVRRRLWSSWLQQGVYAEGSSGGGGGVG